MVLSGIPALGHEPIQRSSVAHAPTDRYSATFVRIHKVFELFSTEGSPGQPPARLLCGSVGEAIVAIDKSLRRSGRLKRSRNVLKREERITQMKFNDRWEEEQSPFGLPKTRVIKTVIGKKKKKKSAEEEGDAAPAKGAKGGKK